MRCILNKIKEREKGGLRPDIYMQNFVEALKAKTKPSLDVTLHSTQVKPSQFASFIDIHRIYKILTNLQGLFSGKIVFSFFLNFPYVYNKNHFQENRKIFKERWEKVGETGKIEKNVFLRVVLAGFVNGLSVNFIPSHCQLISQVYETHSVFRGSVTLSYSA